MEVRLRRAAILLIGALLLMPLPAPAAATGPDAVHESTSGSAY